MTRPGRRWVAIASIALLGAVAAAGGTYWGVRQYFVHVAEENLQGVLLSHRGLHLYIQRVMHPTLYRLKDSNQIPDSLYYPELFSSSYMVREQHALVNEARREAGLPEVYYKMAALNPRNSVNRADPEEARLIEYFNEHREQAQWSEVSEHDGVKYLTYAAPFLPNDTACLRCHGKREDAPEQLQVRYPGPGGFNESVGRIRAIESIRVPVETEFHVAWAMTAALVTGLGLLGSLVTANRWLSRQVRRRTAHLVSETAERQRAEEALRFTQFAVDHLTDAAIWLRDDSTIAYVNNAACERLGYDREELQALCVSDIDAGVPPEKWPGMLARLRSAGSATLATNHRRKDGSTIPVEVAATLTVFSGREYVVSVARDISERLKLEQQLLHAQKMEAVGTLAGGIAHDFNNILTAIQGYGEILSQDLPPGSPEAADVAEISAAAARATELVRQILTFSRREPQQLSAVQPGIIAKEAIKLLRASIPASIEIRHSIDAELWAMGDATGVHQILMNLCTNAWHAMKGTEGTLDVRLERVVVGADDSSRPVDLEPGPWVRLRVSDTGAGMDEATRARVFEPYFSTKGKSGGTGLGLSVVHGIVASCGGMVCVDSAPGKGTTFDVYFRPAEAPEVHVESAGVEVAGGAERILVVDDEPQVRTVASKILGTLGYSVVVAENTEEAWAALHGAAPFGLVLTDQAMPHGTGLQLAERVRTTWPSMPVVLMTGFSEELQGREPHELGLRAVLLKPFTSQTLAQTVRAAIDGQPPP